jgi:HSP20 family protein
MSLKTAAEPQFQNLVRQANKLMDQMQKGYFNFYPGETWTPNVNLYETDDSYQVCVDLAGVDKDKIEVQVADNRLTLRGARPVPTYEDAHAGEPGVGDPGSRRPRVHLMEIDHGAFSREVELPVNARRDRIRASYRNGMLWIEIPKTE